jgi:predicted CoA-binding protein
LLILNAKRFAIVGISRNDAKFGNTLYRELKSRGLSVAAVHPTLESFDGDPCFQKISDANPKVAAVVINVSKDQVKEIVAEANQAGVKHVWLQQGSETPETIQFAKSLNMNVISGKCILMYAEPVKSIHAFHRFIWKLIK